MSGCASVLHPIRISKAEPVCGHGSGVGICVSVAACLVKQKTLHWCFGAFVEPFTELSELVLVFNHALGSNLKVESLQIKFSLLYSSRTTNCSFWGSKSFFCQISLEVYLE